MAVVLLGLLWWFDPAKMGLPLCSFHVLTGWDCPGCGATRATHELLHGRLAAAWHYNALWVLSWPVALYAALSELRASAAGGPCRAICRGSRGSGWRWPWRPWCSLWCET